MPIVKFSYGRPKRNSVATNNIKTHLHHNEEIESGHSTTYYANSRIYSQRVPTRYPKEEGRLCRNIFDND